MNIYINEELFFKKILFLVYQEKTDDDELILFKDKNYLEDFIKGLKILIKYKYIDKVGCNNVYKIIQQIKQNFPYHNSLLNELIICLNGSEVIDGSTFYENEYLERNGKIIKSSKNITEEEKEMIRSSIRYDYPFLILLCLDSNIFKDKLDDLVSVFTLYSLRSLLINSKEVFQDENVYQNTITLLEAFKKYKYEGYEYETLHLKKIYKKIYKKIFKNIKNFNRV